jgi:hypothetical protein
MAGGAFAGAKGSAGYIAELTRELRSLSSLPYGELDGQLKEIIASAKQAVKDLVQVKTAANDAGAALSKLNTELAKQGAHAETGHLGLNMGEMFTPESILASGMPVVAQKNIKTTGGTDLAAALQDIATRIDKFEGNTNNYWSTLFKTEIPYLTKGARSAAEANSMMQQILQSFLPAMKNELLNNPNMPAEGRKLLEELMQYAMSGHLEIDKIKQATMDIKKGLAAVGQHVQAGMTGDNRVSQQLDRTIKSLGG